MDIALAIVIPPPRRMALVLALPLALAILLTTRLQLQDSKNCSYPFAVQRAGTVAVVSKITKYYFLVLVYYILINYN